MSSRLHASWSHARSPWHRSSPKPGRQVSIAKCTRTALGAAVLMMGGAACSGPSTSAKGLERAPSAPLSMRASHASPELSPAPEPETLALIGRWQNPATTVATLSRWTGLPLTANAVAAAVAHEFAEALADDAPIDVAVMLDPTAGTHPDAEPWAAISAPLKSLDAVRRAARSGGELAEVEPSIFRLGPSQPDAADAACYVAPAIGKAQTRLVCGRRDRDARALLPFLTRTLPDRKYSGGDLHLEVRIPVLQKVYGEQLGQALRAGAVMVPRRFSIGEPSFDRALEQAATALAEEATHIARDAELVTLDLDLHEQSGELAAGLRFKGRESWWAGTLASAMERQGPAPSAFYRLPRSATAAWFTQAFEPARHTGLVVCLGELLDGWLRHEGLSATDRSRLTQILSPNRVTGAAFLAASGTLRPSAVAASSARESSATTVKANAPPPAPIGFDFSPGSYWIARIEDSKQPMQTLRDLTDALQRPAIKKWLDGKLPSGASLTSLAVRSVPPPSALPKTSFSIEISARWASTAPAGRSPADAAPLQATKDRQRAVSGQSSGHAATTPRLLHLLAMPEDGATWLALGADPNILAQVLVGTATKNADAADRLKGLPELASFETAKVVAGGFFTLQSLASPAWGAAFGRRHAVPKDVARMLDLAPHRGATPIPYALAVSSDGALTLTGTLHLPKAAIEDLTVAIGSSLAGQLGRF